MAKTYNDSKPEINGTANERLDYEAQSYHHLLPICFKEYDNSNSEFQAQCYEYAKYNSMNGSIPYMNNFSSIFNMAHHHPVNFCNQRDPNQNEKPSESSSVDKNKDKDDVACVAVYNNSKKRHCCEFCTKKFTTKQNLFIHCRTHTNEKPFNCEECSKRFATKQSLILHNRTHTNEKPFQCEICDNKFSTKQNLTVHGRIHTQEKPFACENCDKKFTTKQNLDTHYRTHSDIKPFSCHMCSKQFCTKQNRDTHLKTHISVDNPNSNKRTTTHHRSSMPNVSMQVTSDRWPPVNLCHTKFVDNHPDAHLQPFDSIMKDEMVETSNKGTNT